MAYRFNLLNNPAIHSRSGGPGKRARSQAQVVENLKIRTTATFDAGKLNQLARSVCSIEPDEFPGVTIVANASDNSEKGVVAAHLAKTVAQMPGQSVLLIDADLSSPSIHRAFEMPLSPGLGEYLSNEFSLASLLRKSVHQGLQVLTAGHGIGRESSLLSSMRMTGFISELKNKCPGLVVIISMDVAALSVDAPPFADQADGVVLALDEAWMPPRFKKRPIDLPRNARLLGVIRKQEARPAHKKGGGFHPEDTALSFVRPELSQQSVATSPLVALSRPDSFETEQFNTLTATMIRSDAIHRYRVYMFTSPLSGDGKSYVTCNAAVSLARNTGKQVLILDCDLRSPSIHRNFELPNGPGLTTFLQGESGTLSECIQKTSVDNLFVLTAGPAVPQPLALLSSDRMIRLIEGIKKRFKDMIIVLDAAPPSLVAEGLAVSKMADAIVLVASHKKTPKDEMKKLADLFPKEKIQGIIYNHYEKKRRLFGSYLSKKKVKEAA